jgi:RimJ/RimL family protein N-acetyltransferase
MLVTDRTGRLLGFVNYYRPPHSYQGLEIGYRISRPDDRGKGFVTEAVGLFVGYLLAAKQIERVQALAHPENVGSHRLLERRGFTFEGTLRRAHFDRGMYNDLATYSILRGEAGPLEELLAPIDG